jgi:hypothetical protein
MTVISEGQSSFSCDVVYRYDHTLCDRHRCLSALPFRLSDGCIVPAATRTEEGAQLEGLGAEGLAGGRFDWQFDRFWRYGGYMG